MADGMVQYALVPFQCPHQHKERDREKMGEREGEERRGKEGLQRLGGSQACCAAAKLSRTQRSGEGGKEREREKRPLEISKRLTMLPHLRHASEGWKRGSALPIEIEVEAPISYFFGLIA